MYVTLRSSGTMGTATFNARDECRLPAGHNSKEGGVACRLRPFFDMDNSLKGKACRTLRGDESSRLGVP